ncbi:MAG: hypothetical protein QF367_11980, partial [Acidimicrobiales bacterium]|nr:hypothetical protein [Acidimicrobiales bacterium]
MDFDHGPGVDMRPAEIVTSGLFLDGVWLVGPVYGYPRGTQSYVVKLDSAGDYVWGIDIGNDYSNPASSNQARDIALDGSNNVYVSGDFGGGGGDSWVDFDPGPGEIDLNGTPLGLAVEDAPYNKERNFVAKYDSAGNYVWHKAIATDVSYSRGFAVAADSAGNSYSGHWLKTSVGSSVDMDPGPGTALFSSASWSGWDLVVLKLDASGNYVWGSQISGSANEYGRAIALDSAGNVLVGGTFTSANTDFDPGPGTVAVAATPY